MVLSSHWSDLGRLAAFMTRNGYTDIHPVLASKPPPSSTGMNLTFAVTSLLAGYKGGIGKCALTFSHLNPLFGTTFYLDLKSTATSSPTARRRR